MLTSLAGADEPQLHDLLEPLASHNVSSESANITVLPVQLPPLPSTTTTKSNLRPYHYLYIQPHTPRLPSPDSSRSLFVSNVAIDTTTTHLCHLFAAPILGGARIDRIEFDQVRLSSMKSKRAASAAGASRRSRKRKRGAGLQQSGGEDEKPQPEWPETWDRTVHPSGSFAVVVFVDKASCDVAARGVRKAAKRGKQNGLVWGERIVEAEGKIPKLGSQRYLAHQALSHPPHITLQNLANNFMTSFSAWEDQRARAVAKQRVVLDDDGFETVRRGGGMGVPARTAEATESLEKMKQKEKQKAEGLKDFYRFQTREKRKEREKELVKKFEDDRKKVEEMRKRRKGKLLPEQ